MHKVVLGTPTSEISVGFFFSFTVIFFDVGNYWTFLHSNCYLAPPDHILDVWLPRATPLTLYYGGALIRGFTALHRKPKYVRIISLLPSVAFCFAQWISLDMELPANCDL